MIKGMDMTSHMPNKHNHVCLRWIRSMCQNRKEKYLAALNQHLGFRKQLGRDCELLVQMATDLPGISLYGDPISHWLVAISCPVRVRFNTVLSSFLSFVFSLKYPFSCFEVWCLSKCRVLRLTSNAQGGAPKLVRHHTSGMRFCTSRCK